MKKFEGKTIAEIKQDYNSMIIRFMDGSAVKIEAAYRDDDYAVDVFLEATELK